MEADYKIAVFNQQTELKPPPHRTHIKQTQKGSQKGSQYET